MAAFLIHPAEGFAHLRDHFELTTQSDQLAHALDGSGVGMLDGSVGYTLECGHDQSQHIDRDCAKGTAKEQRWVRVVLGRSFGEQFALPACEIPFGSTDDNLRHHKQTGHPISISIGMSTLARCVHAGDVLGTVRYGVPIGYSGGTK